MPHHDVLFLVALIGCTSPESPDAVEQSAQVPTVAEAETLSRTSNVGTLVETDAKYSAGRSLKVFGTGVDSYVELVVPVVAAGEYQVSVYYKSLDNRPTARLSIDGVQIGPAFDMYTAAPAWQVPAQLGTWRAPQTGPVHVRLRVTGKSSQSAGYVMHVDKIVFTPTGSSEVTIVNANSKKCVDVAGNASANGTNIHQWTCNGTGAQRFVPVGSGAGVALTHPSSGKCVDVTGNGTADGTNIQLWACNGSEAQRFTFTAGRTTIKHVKSGKCVDVANSGIADGTNIRLWSCNNTDAQRFDIGGGVRTKYGLQANLEYHNYWSSAVPFKDLMMQAEPLVQATAGGACPTQPQRDGDGYPTSMSPACALVLLVAFDIRPPNWGYAPAISAPPYRAGRYVFTYAGQADFTFAGDATNVVRVGPNRIELDIPNPQVGVIVKATSFGTAYPRDLHLVHVDDLASYQQAPFAPRFLQALAPFQVIRFMNWGKTWTHLTEYYGQVPPSRQLSTTRVQLDATASSIPDAYANMVAEIRVNNQYPRVFIDAYDAGTKTLTLRSPIALSTDGQDLSVRIDKFVNRTWASRTPPGSTIRQASESGVAFEYMIDLANATKKDAWINIPTAADDDFVRKLIRLIDARLDPSLKAYIEYSNETWNYSGPSYDYSEAMIRTLDPVHQTTVIPADAWHALRASQIFNLINEYTSEAATRAQRGAPRRFVRVLTSQTEWTDRASKVLSWGTHLGPQTAPTFGQPAHALADVFAIAVYYSRPEGQDVATLETLSEPEALARAAAWQNAALDTLYGTVANPGPIRRIALLTKQLNIPIVQYEGGTDLAHPHRNSEALERRLIAFNRSNAMYDIVRRSIREWMKLCDENAVPGGLFSQYDLIGRSGWFGYWPVLESVFQDPNTSPKYRALRDHAATGL